MGKIIGNIATEICYGHLGGTKIHYQYYGHAMVQSGVITVSYGIL